MQNRRWLLFVSVIVAAALGLAACGSDNPAPAPASTNAPPAAGVAQAAPNTYTTVSVREAHDALEANPDAVIVDVRTPQEWATTGVPPGAVLIPLDEITRRAQSALPQDRPVYVICNSGNRSRVASEALVQMGFTSVYNVSGGIQDWLSADLPVEPYRP